MYTVISCNHSERKTLTKEGKVITISKTAAAEWDKANTVQIKMKLQKSTDADILLHLSQQANKQGYLKELIRKDMKESHPSKP